MTRTDEPAFEGGLLPAVVQDADSGRVLMVAYMNMEAWQQTKTTGWVHFWSRSRQELWKKGETSGNTMRVESMTLDCDANTILITVHPNGPACHTGTASCFDGAPPATWAILPELDQIIAERASTMPSGSYTTELLSGGPDATGRKLVEEATEVLLAAKDHAAGRSNDQRVAEEAADLVYHLMVTLHERGLGLSEALAVLATRRR